MLSGFAHGAPELEEDIAKGKAISGVSLYRRMANRWLERDSGKHHIKPDHKLHLAAHLAAWLWQQSSRTSQAEQEFTPYLKKLAP